MEKMLENDILKTKIEIKYRVPKLAHRVLANLIDIIVFAVLFVGTFLIGRAIITHTPAYKEAHANYENAAINSGLYIKKDNGQLVDVVTYITNDSSFSAKGKRVTSEKAINDFYTYVKDYVDADTYNDLLKQKEEYFLSDSLRPKDDDIKDQTYFVKDGDEVVPNPNLVDYPGIDLKYYIDCYRPYIDKYALRQFQSYSVDYKNNITKVANMIIFIAIPIAYVLSAFLTCFVPPLFFKRGRKTLGKALYHIGLIQSDFYNLKFSKWFIRFLIFFFAEMVLSIATVGIPFIISASMMIFSKHKQGFPDYMLGIYEVDTSNNKIYYNEAELTLENMDTHKEPIDFKLPDIEY